MFLLHVFELDQSRFVQVGGRFPSRLDIERGGNSFGNEHRDRCTFGHAIPDSNSVHVWRVGKLSAVMPHEGFAACLVFGFKCVQPSFLERNCIRFKPQERSKVLILDVSHRMLKEPVRSTWMSLPFIMVHVSRDRLPSLCGGFYALNIGARCRANQQVMIWTSAKFGDPL